MMKVILVCPAGPLQLRCGVWLWLISLRRSLAMSALPAVWVYDTPEPSASLSLTCESQPSGSAEPWKAIRLGKRPEKSMGSFTP